MPALFADFVSRPQRWPAHAARCWLLALLSAACASGETQYTVNLAEAASGFLRVAAETSCASAPCEFQMPVWNATYQVRDFAQYVSGFEAHTVGGKPLRASKPSPSVWRVEAPPGERFVVQYRVLADRPGPFGAYVDSQFATLNLAQVLMYPVERRDRPFRLRWANLPEGARVAITLRRQDGVYQARSYAELVDTPVLIGNLEETSFQEGGSQIRIVASGAAGSYDLGLLEDTVRRIVRVARNLMGGLPLETYTFVYRFSEVSGGGMEYRDGTLIFGPADCRTCTMAGLSAHEFFHLWNVKRIRPQSLEPVDFSKPPETPSLWFSEGFTSTYAQYILLAAGLLNEAEFLERLGRLITAYESRPASRTQSAEESSREAWFERYPAYSRPDRSVSYYLQGELIAHLLDLEIRGATGNARSLDDVMRRLNHEYARQGRYFEGAAAIERIAGEVAGCGLRWFFDDLVRRPAPVDWNRFLSRAGYRLKMREKRAWSAGMHLASPPGQGMIVTSVDPGGPAEQAGVRRGDRILRLDGRLIVSGATDVNRLVEEAAGRPVKLELERQGSVVAVALAAAKATKQTYGVVEAPRARAAERRVRQGWLTRQTDDPPEVIPSQ